MGTSMASVSFRRGEKQNWTEIKMQIKEMCDGLEGLVSNLDTDTDGYAIVSPYGDMGMFLADLPDKISALTGDYAVMCVCMDSDFALLELYHAGQMLEECSAGEVYEEYEEFCCTNKADISLWSGLLTNSDNVEALTHALHGDEVFVEDQLRDLSRITGIPVFDDALVYGMQ